MVRGLAPELRRACETAEAVLLLPVVVVVVGGCGVLVELVVLLVAVGVGVLASVEAGVAGLSWVEGVSLVVALGGGLGDLAFL